ncbi:hypothetical protein Py17XNL_000504613 [Plasmodium yoelii yoelii]|uniref:Uncharacterized protein n=1 Tax=Plasmodium yoelii yoelii TaxID=73239 RepID=A0AAF0B2F0_PLAYO|nr:hypothetical protein Py17XNL_000504613 [Plasmodium yoelii yoelii]
MWIPSLSFHSHLNLKFIFKNSNSKCPQKDEYTHDLKEKISTIKYGIHLKNLIQKVQGFNFGGPIVIQLEKDKSTKKNH